MTDPDMGTWSYVYASNGNLLSQTDAKGQTINFAYDALNRLTGKTYSTGMATVSYSYDSTADLLRNMRIILTILQFFDVFFNNYAENGT